MIGDNQIHNVPRLLFDSTPRDMFREKMPELCLRYQAIYDLIDADHECMLDSLDFMKTVIMMHEDYRKHIAAGRFEAAADVWGFLEPVLAQVTSYDWRVFHLFFGK
jgi:hypothetical protein